MARFERVDLDLAMEIDLTQSEDDLLAKMTKSCRWTVRKAEKNGVLIEEAQDEHFAEEYAAQLKDVFAKQGLVPHFGLERVKVLLRHLSPTGMLWKAKRLARGRETDA